MTDGFKAIISLLLAFAVMVPIIILCVVSWGGLLSLYLLRINYDK